MDLKLYNRSGGNPRYTAVVEITNIGGTYTTGVLVAAVPGKRIVPMWLMANSYDAMGAGTVLMLRLRDGSANLFLHAVCSDTTWPCFMKFDEAFMGKTTVNTNLNIAYDCGSGTHGTFVCGYYLR